MRYLSGFLCIGALALAALLLPPACGGNEEYCDRFEYLSWCDDCRAPLSDYCKGSPCPTLDQAVADAMELAQERCGPIGLCQAGAGQCGDLPCVYTACAMGDITRQYFDASGTLVAVLVCSDVNAFCGGRFCIYYGPVPDCEFEPAEDFCESAGSD